MKKIILILILTIAAITAVINPDKIQKEAYEKTVPKLYEPLQTDLPKDYKKKLTMVKKYGKYTVTVEPQAFYKIRGRVMYTMPYYMGIAAAISPTDFAIVWSELEKEINYKEIEFDESNRWGSFRLKERSLFDMDYVGEHFANMHICPSNDNIRNGVKKVKHRDLVYMEGYLVYINGTEDDGKSFFWNSSLTRTDKGNGACEVMFVTKIITPYGIYN